MMASPLFANLAIYEGVGLGCFNCYLLVSCGGTAGPAAEKKCSPKSTRGSPPNDRLMHVFDADMSFPLDSSSSASRRSRDRTQSKRRERPASGVPPAQETEFSIAVISPVGDEVLGRVRIDFRNLLQVASDRGDTTRDFWVPIERHTRGFSGALHCGVSIAPRAERVPRDTSPQPGFGNAAGWIEVCPKMPQTNPTPRGGGTGTGTTAQEAVAFARTVAARLAEEERSSGTSVHQEPGPLPESAYPPFPRRSGPGGASNKITPTSSAPGTPYKRPASPNRTGTPGAPAAPRFSGLPSWDEPPAFERGYPPRSPSYEVYDSKRLIMAGGDSSPGPKALATRPGAAPACFSCWGALPGLRQD
eukprot:tig00000331_g24152.t1